MNARAVWHFVSFMLVGTALFAMTNAAPAGSFTRGCAARDLQILMTIEERENTGMITEERLSDMMAELMNARIVCHEGRVLEALALYDAIAEQMLTVLSERAQANGIR